MQSIYEAATLQELTNRLNTLNASSQQQWGKMNVGQMLAHCAIPIEIALGEKEGKRPLMGRLIGPLIKNVITDEKPFKQNLPTNPNFIMTGEKDFETEKQRLAAIMARLTKAGPGFMDNRRHPFFGKLTAQEWSNSVVKHLDHHFKQFGV